MLMKRMLLLAVLAGIAAGTAGCKQQDAPKLDRQAVRLYVGDQVRITADRPVAWSAADDFYAAVDADGTVTAHIEPDGLPVEFRCILLFASCRPGSDACHYGQ